MGVNVRHLLASKFDGFYVVYYHGAAGPSLGQLQMLHGQLIGADAGGGIWDGQFAVDESTGELNCMLTIKLEPGGTLVTTNQIPQGDEATDMRFNLPPDFATQDYVSLDLPIGRVNVRFKRLR